MRVPIDQRLREALLQRGYPMHDVTSIVADVCGVNGAAAASAAIDAEWDALLRDVRNTIHTLTSNRQRWPEYLRECYEEYRAICHAIVADIEQTRALLIKNPEDPDGPRIRATIAGITAICTKRNDVLRKRGEPAEAACTALWPTWVAPRVIEDMVKKFEIAAAQHAGRGKRVVPFAPTSLTKHTKAQIERHRRFIDAQRTRILEASPPDQHGRVASLYGALHLTALRHAERWLEDYEEDLSKRRRHPALDRVPVNWMHMLAPELRRRVKAADEDPTNVTPNGLTSYLRPEAV